MTRKAAVLGSPIAHSKSPQLHLAAYRALGLLDWTYDRIECTAEQLPSVVSGFGPEWVGVSVTMPGKFAALRFADERTQRAELVGSANTLLHTEHGWRADNTDVDGVVGALGSVTGEIVVLGSGGTARAAVVAAGRLARPPGDRGRPRPRQGGRAAGAGRSHRRRRLGGARSATPAWPTTSPGPVRSSARSRPRPRPRISLRSGMRPCCWTRSTTRGRRRWPPRSPRRAAG